MRIHFHQLDILFDIWNTARLLSIGKQGRGGVCFFCSSDPITGPLGVNIKRWLAVTVAVVLYWLYWLQQPPRAYFLALWGQEAVVEVVEASWLPIFFVFGRGTCSPGRLIWQCFTWGHSWWLSLKPAPPGFQLDSRQNLPVLNPFFLKLARLVLFPSTEPCQI